MDIPSQFSFVKWLKQDVVALADDKYGKKVVVKVNPNAKYLEKFSQLANSSTTHLKTIMPKIYAEGGFVLHDYITGQLSGDTASLFGLSFESFALIDPKMLAQSLWELMVLSNAPVFLIEKPVVPVAGMSKKNYVLEERKSDWYINNLQETQEAVNRSLGAGFYDRVFNYLGSHARLIDANTRTLVNGDLHPENIMIKALIAGSAKDFILSDWDLLHFNNPGYDLADLFVWSWRNYHWRDTLIKEFRQVYQGSQNDLAVCLRFCQTYLACQMIKHAGLMLNTGLSNQTQENAKGLLENSKELLKKLVTT